MPLPAVDPDPTGGRNGYIADAVADRKILPVEAARARCIDRDSLHVLLDQPEYVQWNLLARTPGAQLTQRMAEALKDAMGRWAIPESNDSSILAVLKEYRESSSTN